MIYRRFLLILICFSTIHVCADADPYPSKFDGNFEAWSDKRLDLLSLYLPKDPIILVAGALYGNEVKTMANKWPDAHILSFEPNPHAFEILSSTTAYLDRVKAYPLALNDQAGTATFYVCHGTNGDNPIFEHASSLLKPTPGMAIHYQGPVIDVECVNLDQWCQENDVTHIDCLRLNVRGSEYQVLNSSPHIVDHAKVIFINTFIYPFREDNTIYDDLDAFLCKKGFRLLAHWYRMGLEGEAIYVRNDYFHDQATEEYLCSHSVDESSYERCHEEFFNVYYDLDNANDTIKNALKAGLPYEGNIGMLIDSIIDQGSIVVDIGAHIGPHTIAMSKKVGPHGAVYAFEPDNKLYMEHLHNLQINACVNTISISKELGTHGQNTLDSLNLRDVSLIKINMGHDELSILKGGSETLYKNHPVIIFRKNLNEDIFDQVVALMVSYDYEVYNICGDDYVAFPLQGGASYSHYKEIFQRL